MTPIEKLMVEVEEELGYSLGIYITPMEKVTHAMMVRTTACMDEQQGMVILDFVYNDYTSDVPLYDRLREAIINNFNVAFLGGTDEII